MKLELVQKEGLKLNYEMYALYKSALSEFISILKAKYTRIPINMN